MQPDLRKLQRQCLHRVSADIVKNVLGNTFVHCILRILDIEKRESFP